MRVAFARNKPPLANYLQKAGGSRPRPTCLLSSPPAPARPPTRRGGAGGVHLQLHDGEARLLLDLLLRVANFELFIHIAPGANRDYADQEDGVLWFINDSVIANP